MGNKFALFNDFSLSKGKEHCNEEHRIFDLTREVVCYNQGKIAEYYFIHDKYIFKLIEKFHQLEQDPDNKLYRTELVDIYKEYNINTARELSSIVQANLSFSDTYFNNRREKKVRTCIKLLDHELNVVDPFRANSKKYNYKKNTGFSTLVDKNSKKSNYHCPNIAEFVAAGNYKNVRIDIKCMKSYHEREGKSNRFVKFIKSKLKNDDLHIEEEWFKCWKGYGGEVPNVVDCYKSTLIIPMTFKNNSLSQDFQNYLSQHHKNKEINILGFLCFDHPEINYFNEEKDINFGYKIADLVSLYILRDFISKNNPQYLYIKQIVDLIVNTKNSEISLTEEIKQIKKNSV